MFATAGRAAGSSDVSIKMSKKDARQETFIGPPTLDCSTIGEFVALGSVRFNTASGEWMVQE